VKYDRLVQDAQQVLDTLVPKEVQVPTGDGRWYNLRILPYRTTDNVIDGVVLTFADITAIKQLEESLRQRQGELQAARDFAQSIIATIREPLLVLDGELRIISASRSFYRLFQVKPAETEGRLFYEIAQGQWDIPALRQLLEDILPQKTQFDEFRVEHDFPGIGHKVLLLNARQIISEERRMSLILLAMEDISGSSAAR
jgi:two-component system, chemotaxis family, CheB/CheR fusion protein